MASTPALAQADGTTKAEPQLAAAYVVTMLSTLPPSFSVIHFFAKICVQLKVPLSTMPTTALKALGVSFSVRAMKFPAALLITVSTADQKNARAQRGEMQSHGTTQTGAAARQENRAIL